MNIIKYYNERTYNYKEVKRSLSYYFYCEEENILIGRDMYEKPYAIFLYNNMIIRNITFDNKDYLWRLCVLTDDGVKFLRRNGLLKSYFM